ncbi:MAG: NTP transferase domain-containing protein [Bacilli bacterium]|nr:NTP transferase domain-containing protein [Bacilli bacterium]
MNKYVVILAAGKGTRMNSRDPDHSKVSYPILGKALINYVLDCLEPIQAEKTVTVVGFGGNATKELVKDRSEVVWQKDILGTGHATLECEDILKDKEGITLVIAGDKPLIRTETIQAAIHKYEKFGSELMVVSSYLKEPRGYGRIIREKPSNKVLAVREEKDCNEYEKEIPEVNSGVYLFDNKLLFSYLNKALKTRQGKEFNITEIIAMIVNDGHKVDSYVVEDPIEIFSINDRIQLGYANRVIRKRINQRLMLSGVSIEDPAVTYISPDVVIGKDCVIYPNTIILGKTSIGEANRIGPNVHLDNVVMGNDNVIVESWISDTEIGDRQQIGPFAQMLGKGKL